MSAHTINPTTNCHEFILSMINNASSPRSVLIICTALPSFRASIPADNRRGMATLQTITAATDMEVIFASSLLHLRAYLSTIPASEYGGILAVWGLVEVHRDTNEFSAQGLARTTASILDAGVRSGRKVVVGEWGRAREEVGYESWWEEVMPLLNTTVKVASLGGALAGRTVEVGKILGRWFRLPTDGERE